MGSVELTGNCHHCSYGDRAVIHGVSWCPRFPAICSVDWNAARPIDGDDDHMRHDLVGDRSFSRPVEVGEIVLLFCDDGGVMGTWGRVGKDENGKWVIDEVAERGPWWSIVYGPSMRTPDRAGGQGG